MQCLGALVAASNLELGRLGDGANLELFAILGEDALAVVLPKGLGGVLAAHALDDAGTAGVLVDKVCKEEVVRDGDLPEKRSRARVDC